MEAEDTVMSSDIARNISIDILGLDKIAEIGNSDSVLAFDIGLIQQETALAQAEATWPIAKQAGTGEVVEWIERNSESDGNNPLEFSVFPEKEWQAKLKEWGF